MVSLHAIGPRFRGFIGAVAFLMVGESTEVLPGATFQTNYEESADVAQARFDPWLDSMIIQGLAAWRKNL